MLLLDLQAAGTDYAYVWPDGNQEDYGQWIEYRALGPDAEHTVRIGFAIRPAYGSPRKRVVVWIDDHPQVEFVGADDFDRSGDVLTEIKVPGERGLRVCRYPDEKVPGSYTALAVVGMPTRITGPYVHRAWAVLANVGDHHTLAAAAELRQLDRMRPVPTSAGGP
jgi:hypothetical protein